MAPPATRRKRPAAEVDVEVPTRKSTKVGSKGAAKVGTAVAKVNRRIDKVTRLSKLTAEEDISSIVADSRHEIQQLLETSDNDSASALMKKRMLQMLTDLLPYAENAVRTSKGSRGVYQVNSLITSIRELLIDLKGDQDRGQLGHHMVEQVVRPAFLDVGMSVVQEEDNFLRSIRDELSLADYKTVKQAHTAYVRAVAERVQAEYKTAVEKAVAFMQR